MLILALKSNRSTFKYYWIIAFALCFPLYAIGGSGGVDSTIRTSVTPDFDQGFINVSVTNGTDEPIKVSPVLKSSFPSEEGIQPKCIYICMLFTKKIDIHTHPIARRQG